MWTAGHPGGLRFGVFVQRRGLAEHEQRAEDDQQAKADQDIVRVGDRPSQSCLLLEGFIDAHAGSPWLVSMVGFVAGLLDAVDIALHHGATAVTYPTLLTTPTTKAA